MACQILEGLSHLHKNNVVHRDLKPENILMNKNKDLILVDYGLAKQIFYSKQMMQSRVGTLAYNCPQTNMSKEYDYRTDIFALGVILYELCCNDHFFFELEKWHKNKSQYPQVKLPKEYSNELNQIVTKMLQED